MEEPVGFAVDKLMLEAESEQVKPGFEVLASRLIVPVKLPRLDAVSVTGADDPALIVMLALLVDNPKSVTVTVRIARWTIELLVALNIML